MAPKVLVTGANGFTGSHFVPWLASRGIEVRAMYYPPDGKPDFQQEGIEIVPGDLTDRESLKKVLVGIETVYNIAALYRPTNVSKAMYRAVNVEGVRNLIEEAARSGVRRLVHCSTIGVHGHVENPPANEKSPIKPDDYYQRSKYEGEKLALELAPKLGIEVSVVRPAAIYGPLEPRFLKLAKAIKSGTFIMFGDGNVKYHFIHVDDLSDLFFRCGTMPEAVGEVFIGADNRALTLNRIVELFAEALGVPPPRRRLPFWPLWLAAIVVEFGLLPLKPFGVAPPLHRRRAAWFRSTREFDNSKARSVLGFEPKIPTEEGLPAMVRSYLAAGWV